MERVSQRAEILSLFVKNQSKYKGFAYTLVLDWSIAEDATQEAAIYICDHWEKFTLGTSFGAWARAIVRNRCREILQKEYKERKKIHKIANLIEESVWDEVEPCNKDQIKALQNCIDRGRLK